MPVQAVRRRANSRRGSRLGRREKLRRTVNFNDELGGAALRMKARRTDELSRCSGLSRNGRVLASPNTNLCRPRSLAFARVFGSLSEQKIIKEFRLTAVYHQVKD